MHVFDNRSMPWPSRARKTPDSLIELQIVPGPDQTPIVVRSRARVSLFADRIRSRRRRMGKQSATSWPLASVSRISVPEPRTDAARDPAPSCP